MAPGTAGLWNARLTRQAGAHVPLHNPRAEQTGDALPSATIVPRSAFVCCQRATRAHGRHATTHHPSHARPREVTPPPTPTCGIAAIPGEWQQPLGPVPFAPHHPLLPILERVSVRLPQPDPSPGTPAAAGPLAAGLVAARPFAVRVVVQPTQEPARAATAPARPVEALAPRTIVTPRLVLRALTPGDRAAFTDLLARSRDHLKGRINVHAAGETDAATFDRLLAATETGEARGSQWRRAAFLPTGQPMGMVHVLDIQRGMVFTGDAGWWVAPFHCGNGVATEMVAAMVRHALADLPGGLGLHTVSAAITPHNTASQRVAAKAGFRAVPGAATSAVIDGVHEPHQLWEAHAQPLEAHTRL